MVGLVVGMLTEEGMVAAGAGETAPGEPDGRDGRVSANNDATLKLMCPFLLVVSCWLTLLVLSLIDCIVSGLFFVKHSMFWIVILCELSG